MNLKALGVDKKNGRGLKRWDWKGEWLVGFHEKKISLVSARKIYDYVWVRMKLSDFSLRAALPFKNSVRTEINLEQNSQKLNTWKLCNKLQTNYNVKVWNKFNNGSYTTQCTKQKVAPVDMCINKSGSGPISSITLLAMLGPT